MSLVRLDDVSLAYGEQKLLVHVSFEIEPGERVCLIGRNGTGKTSLFRLITGVVQPDSGLIQYRNGLVMSTLDQELPDALEKTVREVVAEGLADLKALVDEYEQLAHQQLEKAGLKRLDDLQHRIDELDGWRIDQRVELMMTEMALPPDQPIKELSGGWRRRVGLAKALISKPDLLLLDEPTNHLDIVTIQWLENRIRSWQGAVLFITHDRAFLDKLATRICELDRGRLLSFPGSYDEYLERKEKLLEDEQTANRLFDKKLDEEEVWIRQGIKARRTRNEGRVTALKAMRRERAARREQQGLARIEVAEASSSGKRVLRATDVSYAIGGRTLIRNFSTTILRGDRVGIVGPNGVGKTTLIRLLLGELQPDHGEIVRGTQLEIAYFDQYRATLREDWNALDNVAEGQEFIDIGGRRVHVLGYLQDFLFSPERARAPITRLSGGERNRLLLARLFARPSNLMVLDEPTNDLDIETLELLEEQIGAYAGTVLLVSHDRAFIDAVVTQTLVLEGDGRVGEYVGGYSDWEAQRANEATRSRAAETARAASNAAQVAGPTTAAKRKLSYKDQRELEQLPARIEALEAEIALRTEAMNQPKFFQRDSGAVMADQQLLATRQAELEAAYARWQELEG